MDTLDMAGNFGIPGLEAALKLAQAAYTRSEDVKLYRARCRHLCDRCAQLITVIRDNPKGLEGSIIQASADEVEAISLRVHKKVMEWSSWSSIKSFVSQSEIEDGLYHLERKLDAATQTFSITAHLELNHRHNELAMANEARHEEIRQLLQQILLNGDGLKRLAVDKENGPQYVGEIMETIQKELLDSESPPNPEEKQVLLNGLWYLKEHTSVLPPLTDLTGQVTFMSMDPVVHGTYNDIFQGSWLESETVALRLPKAIANDPVAQQKFQREVSVWRDLQHPNVVPLYGVVYEGQNIYSVNPWMECSAVTYVSHHGAADRLGIVVDAAHGLNYLHERGVVHGDPRSENILMSKDTVARISDFGFSKFNNDDGAGKINFNGRPLAPEVRNTGKVSTQSDVYSFGFIIYELLTSQFKLEGPISDKKVLKAFTKHFPSNDKKVYERLCGVTLSCWKENPDERPNMREVKTALSSIRTLENPSGINRAKSVQSGPASIRMNYGGRATLASRMILDNTQEALHEALHNPNPVVLETTSGYVQAGTLEGLVIRAILGDNTKKENDYRSALLLSCYDSSSTDTLFNILARRFHEMGKVQSVQARIDRQYSILSILIWWLSQPAYHIDADVVWQMRSFCDTILPNLTSPTMVDKVYDLLENIKLRERDVASSIRTTVSRRLLERESPPPKELAIALTLIEAERFEQLTPYDYLMFLRDPASDSGVKVACRIHNDVMRWVKEFVLDYDEVEVRASVINIFIDTAAECRKLGNLSSMIAITCALQSTEVSRLEYSIAEVPAPKRTLLEEMGDITLPHGNHRNYRNILQDMTRRRADDCCIPWLAVHLKDLRSGLGKEPPTIQTEEGQSLINVERYTKFIDRVNETMDYQPPRIDREQYLQEVAYVQQQLRRLRKSDDQTDDRSQKLVLEERRWSANRTRALNNLGFDVSSPSKRSSSKRLF